MASTSMFNWARATGGFGIPLAIGLTAGFEQ